MIDLKQALGKALEYFKQEKEGLITKEQRQKLIVDLSKTVNRDQKGGKDD